MSRIGPGRCLCCAAGLGGTNAALVKAEAITTAAVMGQVSLKVMGPRSYPRGVRPRDRRRHLWSASSGSDGADESLLSIGTLAIVGTGIWSAGGLPVTVAVVMASFAAIGPARRILRIQSVEAPRTEG
jgi:hypothetical protein